MNHFLLYLLSPLFVLPVSGRFGGGPDRQADLIFQEIINHGLQLTDYSANFRYNIQTPNGRRFQKVGRISYQQQKYTVHIEDQEIYNDGTTQWIYLPRNKEVYISDYERGGSNVMEMLFQIFFSDITLDYLGEEKMLGIDCDKLRATVMNAVNADFHVAYIWVSKESRMFQKVTFIDQRQSTTNFEFFDYELNTGLEVSQFQFDVDAFPEVSVFDLRDSKR